MVQRHGKPHRRLHLCKLLHESLHLGRRRAAAHAREADHEGAEGAIGQFKVDEVRGKAALALGRVVGGSRDVLRLGEQRARHDVRHVPHLTAHILCRAARRQRARLHTDHLEHLGNNCLELICWHLPVDHKVDQGVLE